MSGAGRGWAACWPELTIAALLVAVVSVGGYAIAGAGGAAGVVIIAALAALLGLRAVPPPDPGAPPAEQATEMTTTWSTVNGFWRKRSDLANATRSLASYDLQVRGSLQNLLAARLAERHDISLYADPDAARRQLLGDGPHRGLWFWLDPQRPAAAPDDNRPGIRPRTLTALIDRLERL